MNNKLVLMLTVVILPFALVATARSQNTFTCGTEQAMAKMPREFKDAAEASATAFRANELMLYINFNPNGSVVQPGFGNADTLRSSIVTGTRFCPPPSLTQAQKDEIVRLVSDDFSPFNIRVTSDPAEFAVYPRPFREMCLITTVPSTIGQPSGVAGVSPFIGIGLRLPNDFAFAFSGLVGNDPGDVAAVVSQESAHLLGLGHQHLFGDSCGFLAEYHPGFGSGPLAFSPLMGEAFTSGINNWFAQSCGQNDYDLINSQVDIRVDDFVDTAGKSGASGGELTGVLESAGDVDFIRINFKKPGPVTVSSDNIDLKVTLLNPGGHVIEEFNDPDSRDVTIPSANGMRYLKIEAASNVNMSAQFMTGTYRVSF